MGQGCSKSKYAALDEAPPPQYDEVKLQVAHAGTPVCDIFNREPAPYQLAKDFHFEMVILMATVYSVKPAWLDAAMIKHTSVTGVVLLLASYAGSRANTLSCC